MHFGDWRASIALRQEDASGYEVRIDAETLDLTPWFGQDRPERTEEPGTAGFQAPLRLNLQAERLIVDTAALAP